MTNLVPADDIERILGTSRHRKVHYGRAVSSEQTVYILHSKQCLDSGIDLRDCRFSTALACGIREEPWDGFEDMPVVLGIWNSRLIPLIATEIRADNNQETP
jgi:hypothetical protein